MSFDSLSGTPTGGIYDVEVERDVSVAMHDGVHLATDVYRPGRDGTPVSGRLPALLHRTPYEKSRAEQGYATWFARHGYVVVVQDVRGTFGSEGQLDLFVNEADDGADTLAWVDQQPWSNGRVGMWGNSYASFTQLAVATAGPSNLVSMIPYQSASHAWRSSVRHAGAFELRWLAWAFWHSATNSRADLRHQSWIEGALNVGAPTTSDWLTRLPLRAGATQLRLVPEYEKWLLRMMQTGDEAGFWLEPSLCPVAHVGSFPACEVLLVGGFYDSYARSTVELFEAMRAQPQIEVRLLMGPWVHGASAAEQQTAGNLDLGPAAAVRDLRLLHLDWFDRTMRDGASDGMPVVRSFVMGGGSGTRTPAGCLDHGGHWENSANWPPEPDALSRWHLHADGTVRVSPAEEREIEPTVFRFDPSQPVPSIGGNVSSLSDLRPLPAGVTSTDAAGGSIRTQDVMVPGGFDQVEAPGVTGCTPPYLPLASRPDVVVFRSEVLESDLQIVDRARLVLYVSTTAADTDFTAKLIDEYPPSAAYPLGYALNITDSIVRLRYRHGGRAELLTPGEVVCISIELYPVSNVFVAGHRLRVDISSSNFPRFDVNPNTGDPLATERRSVSADNRIYHDAARPSRLEFGVVA